MAPDFDRLAKALQAACMARGWLQEDLIRESGVGRSTIQRLWSGKGAVAPNPTTRAQIERTFGWGPRSVEAILNGGEPTLVSGSSGADQPPDSATQPPTPHGDTTDTTGNSSLPVGVQAALDDGTTIATDVIEFPDLHLIVVVKAGSYATEDERRNLSEAMREWIKVQREIRNLVPKPDESSGNPP